MVALQPVLLVLGYAIGGIVYVALAIWILRGALTAGRALLGAYWRGRSRREDRAATRRVAAVAAPPAPRRRAA